MKKLIQSAFAFALLVASVAMTACVSDEVYFNQTETPDGEATGYVTFGEEGVSVITDSEIVRAAAPDVNTFLCTILTSEGAEVMNFTYGERPAQPIELKAGAYSLAVTSSAAAIPAVKWDAPVYGAEVAFNITKGETTTLDPVKCKLSNIKVTVEYDPSLKELLETGSTTYVSLGEAKETFGVAETRAAYYKAVAETNSLVVEMDFILEGKESKMTHTITGVKAGQWRKITVKMPHATEGNVIFQIVIETLTADEEIVVDVHEVAALVEEVIPDAPVVDPLAPTVTWAGHDLTQTTQLIARNFDESGACTLPSDIVVAVKESATIQSLAVEISSTASSFIDELASWNVNQTSFDLCEVTAASNRKLNMALNNLGFLTGTDVQGQPTVTFDLRELMVTMYAHNGTHEFKFTVTDSEGRVGEAVLSILVDKSHEDGAVTGPIIEWVGHDISQAYSITEETEVNIKVDSKGVGFSGFTVDIVSDVLTEDILGEILPPPIDLVNPGTDEIEATLRDLHFPVKEEITNDEDGVLEFSISEFMGALLGLAQGNPGYANFELTVTDKNGTTSVATLQLLLNK